MEKNDVSKELIAIKSLDLLFYNYTSDMLAEMLEIREFKHCWDNYLDESKLTNMQIWEFFLYKNSLKTQRKILAIAYKHYHAQAAERYKSAFDMEKLLEEHVRKHQNAAVNK